MNKFILIAGLSLLSSAAFAEHVNGYYRSNGTYVNSYERSDRNNTVTDNYSFKGNTNPYTGAVGNNYERHDTTSPYFNGTTNSNGQFGHQNQGNGLGGWGN